MASGGATVPSVYGQGFNFTVSGTNTLAYTERFGNAIAAALANGSLSYSNLSDPGASVPGYTQNPGVPVSLVEQEISESGAYTLPDTVGGSVFTFVSAGGSTTVTGSGIGDNVLFAGSDASGTYIDQGGSNSVEFVFGNNTYVGDSASSAGTDTIVAGSGDDTVTTGAGDAIVYAGTGSGFITLSDTVAAGATTDTKSVAPTAYSQFVYLDDGTNVVEANGVADVVVATAPDQYIVGGSAGDTDLFALVPPGADGNGTVTADTGTPTSGDYIDANGAYVSVYDATDGNTIHGGTGALVVLFADSVQGYVEGGSGTNTIWGNDGDTISYTSGATTTGIFVLGPGAESVDASGAAGQLTFVLGTGNDTLTAGTNTTFNANYDPATGLSGSMTINDFGATDSFDFVGYTADQYAAALATGTQTADGYQITLSDNTTVTFVGLSSLSGHTTNS